MYDEKDDTYNDPFLFVPGKIQRPSEYYYVGLTMVAFYTFGYFFAKEKILIVPLS
jgi:hypothetical protein